MPIRFLSCTPSPASAFPSPFRCPRIWQHCSFQQQCLKHAATAQHSGRRTNSLHRKRQKDPVHESAPNCHHCTGRLPERSNAAHFAHANACHQNIRTEHQADPTGHRLPLDGVQPPLCEKHRTIPEKRAGRTALLPHSADCRPVRFSRQYRNVTVLLL